MRPIDVENGDVIGVAVQQSDFPMVQFSLNGESLHLSAINRFRGTVYPAIYLPAVGGRQKQQQQQQEEEEEQQPASKPIDESEDGGTGDTTTGSTFTASLVVDERIFKFQSPGSRFGPVIVARSIV